MKENKQEAWFATSAALIVLFTTMLNPVTSASLAFAFLILIAIYHFFKK